MRIIRRQDAFAPRGMIRANETFAQEVGLFLWISVLLVAVPLAELAILLQMARWIGVLPTVGIVLTTGLCGAILIKYAGASVIRQIREQIARGEIPADGLIEGALVLVGGAFLLTPGILTDLTGFALLFPPTRVLFRERLKKAFRKRVRGFTTVGFGQSGPGQGGFKHVDVDVSDTDQKP